MLGTICVLSMISCSKDDDGPKIILNGDDDPTTVVDGNNTNSNKWYGSANAMRLEMPALQKGSGYYFITHEANISNSTTRKTVDYSYEYDSVQCHSRWVAFVFNDTTAANSTSRSNAWAEDPVLPTTCRLPYSAYSGSGYTRGHLCASYDRLFSTEANQKTFYMSNMSPQDYDFNGYYWVVLEQLIQNWGRKGGFKNLYVCKGGTIAEGQVRSTFKSNTVSGRSVKIPVPKYYFAAVLAETEMGTYQAIGFWVQHKDYGYTDNNYPSRSVMKQHAVSIDELEEKTGLDFFCNLADAAEQAVEKKYSTTAWTW